MPNIVLTVEYDGSRFHGWQFQPGLKTIEGSLLEALRAVLREDIRAVSASGRTDAGVHARGQVVNFRTQQTPDLYRLRHAVSSVMRGELSVLKAEFAPDDFHSTRSAKSKQYSYRILNRQAPAILDQGRVWFVPKPLDLERMRSEAAALIGERDFKVFQGQGCSARTTIKTIFESEVISDGDEVIYRVVGSGFLKHMVRSIVGTLVLMGHGRISSSMEEILAARDRRRKGVTAPAHGLYLDWVTY